MENRDKSLSDKIKRDYDKDPIIIKDFRQEVVFYLFMSAIFCMFFTKILFDTKIITFRTINMLYVKFSNNSVFTLWIVSILIVSVYFKKIIKVTKFYFYDSKIDSNFIKIFDTHSLKEKNFKQYNFNTFILLFLSVIVISLFSNINITLILFEIMLLIYLPFVLYSIFRNKTFRNCFFLYFLEIKYKNKKIIVPIFTKKEKNELKNYFLEKIDVDIDKV